MRDYDDAKCGERYASLGEICRGGVAQKLKALLDRRAEKVNDLPDDEIDAVIDQAVDEIRHRHR